MIYLLLSVTNCTASNMIFENSLHDFPKKLRYKLNQDKNITVFVSGEKSRVFQLSLLTKTIANRRLK